MVDEREGPVPANWRDPASYGYTQDLTQEGWAWEYLRRNPDYRKTWRDHADPSSNDPTGGSQAHGTLPAEISVAAAAWACARAFVRTGIARNDG